ncbi:MAG: hypothetical protein ACJZ59_04545 [Candidatus Thalassarchaeaceae archaeon]
MDSKIMTTYALESSRQFDSIRPTREGCLDSPMGILRPDIRDPFPNDNQEWNDQDLDGVGDNADAFDTRSDSTFG